MQEAIEPTLNPGSLFREGLLSYIGINNLIALEVLSIAILNSARFFVYRLLGPVQIQ